MRRFIMLSLIFFFACQGYGQFLHAKKSGVMKTSHPPLQNVQTSADRGARSIIWSDDFSDPQTWVIGEAYELGYPYFRTGLDWQIGVQGPRGGSAIPAIRSTTADNNFAMVDSDFFGDSVAGFGVENCWIQTVAPISTLGYDYVSIMFETQYYMWDNGVSDGNEYCLLELSHDGITWPDVLSFEVGQEGVGLEGSRFELWPNMKTQDPVLNPTLRVFNISDYGGNQDSLYVRFRWKGTYAYAWMIDDVEIIETPINDLTLYTSFRGDVINDWDLYSIPDGQEQAMTFGVGLANYGLDHQIDSPMDLTVTGAMDYSDTFGVAIGSGIMDTIWWATDFIPTSKGLYTVKFTVPEDDLAAGDEVTTYFERTQYVMGHFSEMEERQIEGFDQEDECSIGNQYAIKAPALLGGVRAAFAAGTTVGMELALNIYEVLNGDIQDLKFLAAGSYVVQEQDVDGLPVVIPLKEVLSLEEGQRVLVELAKFPGSERFYLWANPFDDDRSTVCFGDFGSLGVNWYYGWNWTPWIDLVLDPSLGVSKQLQASGISLGPVYPNPGNGRCYLPIEISNVSDIAIDVFDIQGNLRFNQGLRSYPAGQHHLEIDLHSAAAGMYFYAVKVNGIPSYGSVVLK